jgi:hypothetical protein
VRVATVVIVNQDGMGHGDEGLGRRILGSFLGKARALQDLESICFYNAGVRLLCEGSPALQPLLALQDAGVDLVACGTCVQHFGVAGALRVGAVSGMDDIVARLARATKVITL